MNKKWNQLSKFFQSTKSITQDITILTRNDIQIYSNHSSIY